jgi:hypothetical protein
VPIERAPDLVIRTVAGQTLVVPVRSSVADLDRVYTFNEVSSSVWQRIDGKTSVDAIVDAICAEYEVSREEAARDVEELLTEMERLGLVRRSKGEGES